MRWWQYMLFPFSVLYGLMTWLRNFMYDTSIFKSSEFDVPTICVGNLSAGGTGKTPMIEWLTSQYEPTKKIAVLSRGYGRKSTGYAVVNSNDEAERIGDEPLQLKTRFPELKVVVCESRVEGMIQLMIDFPETELVLLDDAFQHRSLKADCNIILTSFSKPFYKDWLIPAGTLREISSGKSRAQIIVITKSPIDLNAENKSKMIEKIKPAKNQLVVFSCESFCEFETVLGENSSVKNAFVVTGIANPQSLLSHLDSKGIHYVAMHFPDHYIFKLRDIDEMILKSSQSKTIITTYKDWMRLKSMASVFNQHQISIIVVPVKTKFDSTDETLLNKKLGQYLHTKIITTNVE